MNKFYYKFNKNEDLGKNFLFYDTINDTYICTCGHHGKYEFNVKNNKKLEECPKCKTKARINFTINPTKDFTLTKRYIDEIEYDNNGFYLKENIITFSLQLEASIVDNKPVYNIVKDSLKIESIKEYLNLKMYYIKDKKNERKLKTEYEIEKIKHPFTKSSCKYLYYDSFFEHVKMGLSKVSCCIYEEGSLWNIYRIYKYAPDLIQAGYNSIKGTVHEIKVLNKLFLNREITPIFDQMINTVEKITKGTPLNYNNFTYIFEFENEKQVFNIDKIKYILALSADSLEIIYKKTSVINPINYFYKFNYTPEEADCFLSLAIRQDAPLSELYRFNNYNVDLLAKYNVKIEKIPKDMRIFFSKINLLNKLRSYNTNDYELNGFDLSLHTLAFDNGIEFIIKYIIDNDKDFFKTVTEFVIQKEREGKTFAKLRKNGKDIENCIVEINKNGFNLEKIERIYFKNNIYENENEIKDSLFKLSMEEI